MRPHPLRPLAHDLGRQFGLVTTAQAEAAGVRAWTLTRAVAAGELERLYRGVYASTLMPDTWERRWLAIQLNLGEAGAISHAAAAHLHGLEHTGTRRRPPLEVSVGRGRDRPLDGVRLHTQVPFRPSDVVELGPWRVTSVAWTLASLAHRLGPSRTERAVGSALARSLTTRAAVASCVPRRRACPGVPILRVVVLRLSPELRLTASEAERIAVRLVLAAGLPPPEVNLRVVDRAGNVRVLDLAWPEWGVCVEIDVHPEHATSIGRNRDGHRQNDLVPEWTPLRFDELDLRFDPNGFVDVIRRTLAAAGAPV